MKKQMLIEKSNKSFLNKHHSCIHYGKLDKEENVLTAMSEFNFYYLYCHIYNISAKEKLSETQMVLLCTLMLKPLDFNIAMDSKDGKLASLAEEINFIDNGKPRTANSIYQLIKKLKQQGHLVFNEDKMIVPIAAFQSVRRIVKEQFENSDYASFDYLFKCIIRKDEN
jgi:hypothetical protein